MCVCLLSIFRNMPTSRRVWSQDAGKDKKGKGKEVEVKKEEPKVEVKEIKPEGIRWRTFLRGVVKGVRDEDTKMDILKVKK